MNDPPGEENEYFFEGRGVTAVIAPWNFPLAIITGMSVGCARRRQRRHPQACRPVACYRPPPRRASARGGRPAGRRAVPTGARSARWVRRSSSTPAWTTLRSQEAARRARDHRGARRRRSRGSGASNGSSPRWAARTRSSSTTMRTSTRQSTGTVASAFGYGGQKCSACSRLIIVGSAYEPAVERLRNAVASLVSGPPHDPATQVPPVISADARGKILGYIEEGKRSCTLVAQGPSPGGDSGYYVSPTVFADVPRRFAARPGRDLRSGPVRVPRRGFRRGAADRDELAVRADRRGLLPKPEKHRAGRAEPSVLGTSTSTARLRVRSPAASRSAGWRCPAWARRREGRTTCGSSWSPVSSRRTP